MDSEEEFTPEEEKYFYSMSIHNPVLNDYHIGYITISSLMLIFMTICNAFVLLLFYQERYKLKISHKFVISMAFCDFLSGAVYIPIMIYKYETKLTAEASICPKISAILISIFQTSLFVVTTASVDRFWAVVFPVHYRNTMTPKIANFMIVISWIVPWIFGITHLFTFRKPPKKDLVCFLCALIITEPLLIVLMSSIAINLLTMIVLYVFIHRAMMKVLKRESSEGFFMEAYKIIFRKTQHSSSELKNREIRSTLLILLVIILALITFLPSTVNIIIMTINPSAFDMKTKLIIYVFLTANSVFNPILYAFNIKNIRKAALKLVGCQSRTNNRDSVTAMTSFSTSVVVASH